MNNSSLDGEILEAEMKTEGKTDSRPVDLEKDFNTEEILLVGAKTMAGIGLGFVFVVLGATGLGAVLEATILPTALTKAAGAIAGGALGLSKGVSDSRKEKNKRADHKLRD